MSVHSDMSRPQIQAVLSLILGSQTIGTRATRVQGETTHDAVSGSEIPDGGAHGDDGAGALVGGGAGEGGGECSGLDHAVGVAVGCYCDFD